MKVHAFILIAVLAACVFGTALGDKAAQMQPGTISEFTGTSFPTSLISTGTDNILNYANSAVWDPNKKEVRFNGQGHMEAEKMIIYDDATNAWRNNSAAGNSGIGHGYDHNAVDPATGVNYYRFYNGTSIRKFSNGAWSSAPSLPSSPTICGSLEYFPEMNALIFTGGNTCYRLQGSSWSRITGISLSFGPYHSVSEYSTSAKAVFFGGGNGSRTIYKLASTGQITRMADAPVVTGVYNGSNAPLTADPVSGELIILALDRKMYAYNPGSNQWRTLPLTHPFPDVTFTVTAPISTYRVIMILRRGKVYLYKHDPATGLEAGIPADVPGGFSISVRPNPVFGSASILFHGLNPGSAAQISVFNFLGREVARFTQAGFEAARDLSCLPAGVYRLQAECDGKTAGRTITLAK